MIEILKLIGAYIGASLMMGYCLALLIVLFITVIYGMGYLYDSIFGNSLYKLGVRIAKMYPQIRKSKILLRVKKVIEPKERFTRYETPLCTYCFSYTALAFICMVLETIGAPYAWILAFVIYIVIYFVGMYRRYGNGERYSNVLENNLEFLKLSFVPLAFLITIVGFVFSLWGINLQQVDFAHLGTIVTSIQENGVFTGVANEIWLVIECGILILLLMYILSIPMQLIAYYIILVIKYFQKHGCEYKNIIKFWKKTYDDFC